MTDLGQSYSFVLLILKSHTPGTTANQHNSAKDFNDQTCQRAGVEEGALLPLKEVDYVMAFYSCKFGEYSGKTFLPIGTRLQYDVVSAMRSSPGRTA